MHVGIIIDGNRRFAKQIGKKPWDGHKAGAEKVNELFTWAKELGIKELTLYCFSTENFNRPKEEVQFLMDLFKKWFKKMGDDKRIREYKIKIKFIGKRELLDKEVLKIMDDLEEKTKENNNYLINFAMAYGGRQEILSAVKKLIESKEEVNEENFEKNLWLSDKPDFIIRTGVEKRSSNFLPWQSAYSEWIFFDKMWPEITKEDLKSAIEEFQSRERRFGK
ncbi:Tritrans,polycis-undecaprenyl-diphosphate synthase (GGDP specific) [uncultured archaeon]|nr:Tritrans,polycis-undecaprenyl-diphosphate synthase (GGDP specific) [uncultured archaeon]